MINTTAELGRPTPPASSATVTLHPMWVRITHWMTAASVIVLVLSGWKIYNASPIFASWTFPSQYTLGGWLGGALQWHFAAMWVLLLSGLPYLMLNLTTGRLWRKFFPLSAKLLWTDIASALRGKLSHADPEKFNAAQKAAYLSVILTLIIVVMSGLAIWKSVQFPLLRELMGGYDNARIVHFLAMGCIVAFFVVHMVMVALVPRSLLTMLHVRRRSR